ncbi:MAG TPA: long-chain fatty acid--CoA ligase [Candidatus Micrarchaeia archaeon]|nr:long-chain fatty acid--CoA ligase [Candidatus Micrarchaeia archaeon]
MQGLMMEVPLTLTHVFERGTGLYPRQEVVTQRAKGPPRRATFAEVGERTRRLARALHDCGVRPGDRVATLAWNTQEHLECYFAVPCMGAVLHTLNFRLHPDQLAYVIADAKDRVIVCQQSLLPLLAAIADRIPSVRQVICFGEGDAPGPGLPEVAGYEALLAAADGPLPWPRLDERQAAGLCHTSATTGDPKGVLYSHRSSYLHALTCLTASIFPGGLSDADVLLPVVPMFHVNGWGQPHACMFAGAGMVMPDRFLDPGHLLHLLAAERVTIACGVPSVWWPLLERLDAEPTRLPRLRAILCGGSAAPPALLQGFDRHRLTMVHAWGMTETSPLGTVALVKHDLRGRLGPAEQLRLRATQGLPAPGVELRLADLATGEPCPHDGRREGELQVRGPWVCRGYAGSDDRSAFTDDGWLRTGDVATIDPEGYLRIVDRTTDLVKSGGEWISSVTLESLLMGHPDVAEAAVVGRPDVRWGERPVAFVVARGETQGRLTAESLRDHLRPHVASFWLPDAVRFVDALPKTGVGKFDKRALRRTLLAAEPA